MREFQDKKKRRRMFYSLPVVALLFVVVLLLAKGVVNIYIKYRESVSLKQRAVSELALLQVRKDTLSHEIDRLSTEAGVESAIRNKFNVVKPGEKVLLLVDPEEEKIPSSTPGFFEGVVEKMKSFLKE